MKEHIMAKDLNMLRDELASYAMRGFNCGLFSGTNGNLSLFVRSLGVILITPSKTRYENMGVKDIIAMDTAGRVLDGARNPSSEWRLHTAIYNNCENVNAVVHTHSPYVTTFAVLRAPIPAVTAEFLAILGRSVECADFAPPGSQRLGGLVALKLANGAGACLMANHGAVATGSDILSAYTRAEYLEAGARIYYLSRLIGAPTELSKHDLEL